MENGSRGILDGMLLSLSALALTLLIAVPTSPYVSSRTNDRPGVPPLQGNYPALRSQQTDDPLSMARRLCAKDPEVEGQQIALLGKNAVCEYLRSLTNKLGDGKLLILPVEVEAAFARDGSENRRRTRYAVTAGLHRAGYGVEEPNMLRAAQWEAGPSGGAPITFAFAIESFVPFGDVSDKWSKVVVLWVPDGHLFKGQVDESLGAYIANLSPENLRAIGPASSGALMSLYGDDEQYQIQGKWSFYNATATAAKDDLIRFAGLRKQGNVSITNYVASDRSKLEALVGELLKRGVLQNVVGRDEEGDAIDFGKSVPGLFTTRHRIILVSEANSRYGAVLLETFADVLSARLANIHQPAGAVDLQRVLLKYVYYRGIDQEMVGAPQTALGQSPINGNVEAAVAGALNQAGEIERAQGLAQYDYLRRIPQDVRMALSQDHGAQVVAVGVLGYDAYDKLLMLQALRREFPQAVFFTTDLDARLLHPKELPWTRNLIVAACRSLAAVESGPPVQNRYPPMRDSYQVAMIHAAEAAVGVNPPIPPVLSPRIFEVGRSQYVEMSQGNGHLAPRRPGGLGWGAALFATAIALVVRRPGATARRARLGVFRRSRNRAETLRRYAPAFLILGTVVAVLILARIDTLEPDDVLQGVSIWPFVCLHLVAAAIAAWATMEIVIRRRKSLEDALWQLPRWRRSVAPRSGFRLFRRIVGGMSISFAKTPLVAPPDRLTELSGAARSARDEVAAGFVRDLREIVRGRGSILAVAVISALMIAAFVVVLKAHPTPDTIRWARGGVARISAEWAWSAAFIALIVLTATCLDTARTALTFIAAVRWLPELGLRRRNGHAKKKCKNGALFDSAALRHQLLEAVADSCVRSFIWPFVVLLMMVVGQTRLFDRFSFSITGVVALGGVATICLVAVGTLQLAAGRARRALLYEASSERTHLVAAGHSVPRCDAVVDQLRSADAIVFRPLWAGPLARAALPAIVAAGIIVAHLLSGRL